MQVIYKYQQNSQMDQTMKFLSVIDNKIKRSHTNNSTRTYSIKQKLSIKRNSKYPFAKAINFTQDKYDKFPKWLIQKQGFSDFMYQNYEKKLMSIPKICEKQERASDQKYFVSLFLSKIPIFSNLPSVVSDIILSKIKTKYYKTGEVIHDVDTIPQFMGVIFIGSVQYKHGKKLFIKEKNEIFMTDAFYTCKHQTIISRQESVILTLDRQLYEIIMISLRQQIQTKQKDLISDLMKSKFFNQLHIKQKNAKQLFQDFQLHFYFRDQILADAGNQVQCFYMIFKGEIIQQNHIYIREHNKWPLPNHKWEVRAVYNSFHKNNILKQFDFFGDEEIITNSKFKSKYISKNWAIVFTIPTDKFISKLSSEQVKRLKKYRSQHVDFNYGDVQKNIRNRVKSLSEKKKIVHKAINTSLASKNEFTAKKMGLIQNFEKSMLNKTFFTDDIEKL